MKVKGTQSCPTLWNPMDWRHRPWNSPGWNAVSSGSLLQGIFPTQGLNPGLLNCWWIISQLSHQGSPRILESVAYPFSSGSSWPRNQTRFSCIAGRFFTRRANLPAMQENLVWFLGWEDPLEKGTATHSSILAWRIPRTEEPGRLQSIASQSQTRLINFHFQSL